MEGLDRRFLRLEIETLEPGGDHFLEESDSAAWKGAASRAVGARGGARIGPVGGVAAPPNPPASFCISFDLFSTLRN